MAAGGNEAMAEAVQKIHLIFDLERGRLVAREFLRELAEQNWPVQVTGASKRDDIDPMQRETVIVGSMQKAKVALVLVTPMAAISKNLVEEIKFAKRANLRVIGTLIAGASATTHLPEGLHASQVTGLDWAALKKMVYWKPEL